MLLHMRRWLLTEANSPLAEPRASPSAQASARCCSSWLCGLPICPCARTANIFQQQWQCSAAAKEQRNSRGEHPGGYIRSIYVQLLVTQHAQLAVAQVDPYLTILSRPVEKASRSSGNNVSVQLHAASTANPQPATSEKICQPAKPQR